MVPYVPPCPWAASGTNSEQTVARARALIMGAVPPVAIARSGQILFTSPRAGGASADVPVLVLEVALEEARQPPLVEELVARAAGQMERVVPRHHGRHHEAVPHEPAAQEEAGDGGRLADD